MHFQVSPLTQKRVGDMTPFTNYGLLEKRPSIFVKEYSGDGTTKWQGITKCQLFLMTFYNKIIIPQCPPPPWDQGGGRMIFVSSARQGEATAKLQEPGWGHIQGGKMILGSQAGGDCFIMTNCWYFHKMFHLEFYKFCLRCYLIFF